MTPQEFLASGGFPVVPPLNTENDDAHAPSIARIIDLVINLSGVTVDDIKGRRRSRDVLYPRHVAILLAFERCRGASLPRIGRAFGGRDHTSIMHVIHTKAPRMKDPEFKDLYNAAREALDAS